jgi:hypothetical protein
MAADETTSRIDRVFGDGSLIDETLRLAPREAIARHQQSTQPSAETMGVELLLTDEDLSEERTAQGLVRWFEDRLSMINRCPAAKRPALLHQRSFKKFYEEMYSFAHFVRHLYEGRQDVTCELKAHQDYDAVVRDHSTTPPTTTYVQLTTTTFDRDESRRMLYLLKHGWVPAWGRINAANEAELEVLSQEEKLKQTCEDIQRVAQRKSRFSYGPAYVLVVGFDDFMWFGTEDDRAALRSFVSDRLERWRLNVATLYVLGISGRTFLSFPASRS